MVARYQRSVLTQLTGKWLKLWGPKAGIFIYVFAMLRATKVHSDKANEPI